MKIAYTVTKLHASSLRVVEQANAIIREYQDRGFRLTLRQLYYQFVSRDLMANTVQSYKRLGSIVNDARLSGLIDWEAIEDRTRSTRIPSAWDAPKDIILSAEASYAIDKWDGQKIRPEVWVEKEALAGVVAQACRPLNIAYLSCRGYTSQSEMWGSAMRLRRQNKLGQEPLILHLGDHDPSGLDMTRDIEARLRLFGAVFEFKRIALNMDQVEEHKPPPNPAKQTDARFAAYEREFGDESWELDALDPELLTKLITDEVLAVRNEKLWKAAVKREDSERAQLAAVGRSWHAVQNYLESRRGEEDEEDET